MRYFAPNWGPPYDTEDKRRVIAHVLRRLWDPDNKIWVPAPWATPGPPPALMPIT